MMKSMKRKIFWVYNRLTVYSIEQCVVDSWC